VQPQLVSDLCCIHCVGQVLLVGKHQQHSIAQLVLQRPKQEGASVRGAEQGQGIERCGGGTQQPMAGRGCASSRACCPCQSTT
jgi:hypothetical protein